MEPLLEKAEQYSKVVFELVKLKALAKTSDVASTLASRSLFVLTLLFFTFTLTIGVSLWIGDILGKAYYGFLIVAAFYGLIGVISYVKYSWIKERIRNSVISHMLN